jgi:hypothetical protein
MSDAEWLERARLGGRRRQEERRVERIAGHLEDTALRQGWFKALAALLDSDDPAQVEAGVLAIALAFNVGSNEELTEALSQIRPEVTFTPRERAEKRLDGARARLRELHREGRIDAAELPPGVLESA